jgi:hypothetical protein
VPGFVRASAEFLQHHSSHGASGLSPNAFAQLDWIEDDEDVGCSRERERVVWGSSSRSMLSCSAGAYWGCYSSAVFSR